MSQPNWKGPLGLAAALFVIGTFAYWLEYKHKPEKEQQEEKSKKVFQIKDTQVESVQVVLPERTLEMKCSDMGAKLCKPGDNSKWELVAPLKTKADGQNVGALVSTLNNLQFMESIDLKDETPEKRNALLKEYGLDEQSRASTNVRKVQAVTPNGGTVLYMGLGHPIGDSTFGVVENFPAGQKAAGKPDENKVYLIPNYLKSTLERDLTYWREKKLLTVSAHEIEAFELKGTKAQVKGEKKDGKWTIRSKNEEYAGDIENIDSLLTAVSYMSAKDFASDSKTDPKGKSALSGAKAVVQMTIQKEKGSEKEAPAPIQLALYEKEVAGQPGPGMPKDKKAPAQKVKKLFATVSNLDPVYELEPHSKERLDKELKDLRLTKLITSMERFGAKRLEFGGKPVGDSIVLTQADGKWVNQADKSSVNNEKIQGMLDKLSGNRIKEFLTGSKIPSGEQDGLKFTLGDDKETAKRQLVFWKKDGKLYGRDLQSKRNEAYLVDTLVQDGLPWSKDFFKESAAKPADTKPADHKPADPGHKGHAGHGDHKAGQ